VEVVHLINKHVSSWVVGVTDSSTDKDGRVAGHGAGVACPGKLEGGPLLDLLFFQVDVQYLGLDTALVCTSKQKEPVLAYLDTTGV
jgi:hypothetical protein